MAGSDPRAVSLADSVLLAMGGGGNWASTRILKWDFFGRRKLLWNKAEEKVRILVPKDSLEILLDLQQKDGIVSRRGTLLTDRDSLDKYLELGRRIWINDSYWLVMPFKLKDPGVRLAFLGRDTLPGGLEASVLELTFENVGVTPENKYHIWVGDADHLVRKWAYFREKEDTEPRLVTPWDDYRPYGDILLSGDRGPEMQLTGIAVFDSLPGEFFASLDRSPW